MREALSLATINDYWNRKIKYESDMVSTGLVDYWQTPLESFMHEKGDCEDYAIAKYLTLILEGYKNVHVVTTVLTHPNGNKEPHVVVTCNGWVLDNAAKEIVKLEQRIDLAKPLYLSSHLDLSASDPRFKKTWLKVQDHDEFTAMTAIVNDIIAIGL